MEEDIQKYSQTGMSQKINRDGLSTNYFQVSLVLVDIRRIISELGTRMGYH